VQWGWLPVALVIAFVAGFSYWYKPQLLQTTPIDDPGIETTPLAPSLYGSPERELALPGVGVGVLVEGDGPSPLAVILAAGAADVAAHAGVQAMLERAGVGSLALPIPADSVGASALTRWVAEAGAARRLPIRLVVPGSLLDRWLGLTPPGSIPLLILGPTPPRRTLREVWLTRLRLVSDTIDARLTGWDDAVAVVDLADTLAARRLVRPATRGRVMILTGEVVDPPSPHPDPGAWREVIAVLRGYWEGQVEVEVGEEG
jgi:hypothetical protein